MSPRDFNAHVVQLRLSLIRDLLGDLEQIGSVSGTDLLENRILRHAVERILTQLVDLAVSINGHVAATQLGVAPPNYAASFDQAAKVGAIDPDLAAQLRDSVGFRNVLTHEYVAIDLDLVAAGVDLAREGYGAYLRQVAGWVAERT